MSNFDSDDMRTDRELLELAAKASGREGDWVDFAGMDIRVGYQGGLLCGDADRGYYWNPLKDDGDAFRLETEMSFTVLFWAEGVEVGESEFVRGQLRPVIGKSAYETYACHDGDKNAARRKAATHAAAKIGRAMPTLKQLTTTTEPITEPVNARLLEALRANHQWHIDHDDYDGYPGSELEATNLAAISAAEARQERLLHDMHDAGREIDRVMAEPAQKAVRLTMGECMQAVKHISFEEMTLFGIARAIETAVLRKNGIEVAE